MTSELRVCPNCGAYVMSGDNICPRCDFDLTSPVPNASEPDDAVLDAPDSPPDDEPLESAPLAAAIEAVEVTEPDDTAENGADESAEIEVVEVTEPADNVESEADSSAAIEAVEVTEPADSVESEADESAEIEAEADVSAETSDSQDTKRTTSRLPQVRPMFEIGRRVETGSAPAVTPSDSLPPAPTDDESSSETRASAVPPGLPEDEALEHEPDRTDLAAEDTANDVEAVAEDEPDLPPADSSERVELREGLVAVAAALDADPSEMPTRQFDAPPVESEAVAAEITSTQITPQRQSHDAGYIIPPAPYTPPPPPPPTWITPPAELSYYAAQQGVYEYLQQRVQAYQRGGYRLHVHAPHEATLSTGKGLSVGGWILALVTIIGFFWYLLILAVSGFQADTVYIVLETDGRVYEDGPGAAHVRLARARAGRRWSIFGILIFLFCFVLAILLGAVAGIVTTQKRYQAALREAYPAVTLFEERFDPAIANPDDVQVMKDGAVVFAILGGIAAVGLWGGATLFVIGTVHAGAYRVRVPPLPGYA